MSNEITTISNHISVSLNNLLQQYKGRTNWTLLITALVGRVQDLENACETLKHRLDIDSMTGVQLDGIGKIVGQPRYGYADDYYRLLLKMRVAINRSQGLTEQLINVVKYLTNSPTVQIREVYPAGFQVHIDIALTDPLTISFLKQAIQVAKQGGVDFCFVSFVDPTNPFTFGLSTDGDLIGTGEGFSSIADPTSGGKLGYLY